MLWIGTRHIHPFRFRPASCGWGQRGNQPAEPLNPTFRRITQSRLGNDTVYSVLGHSVGNLWISTDNGLTKFTPATGTFRNYDVSDGLQGNEFNGGAAFQSPDTEVFFSGIDLPARSETLPIAFKPSAYQLLHLGNRHVWSLKCA